VPFRGLIRRAPTVIETMPPRAFSEIRSPDMNTPSTPSPGPGWWMASDGNWYPQQWEYVWCSEGGMNAMNEQADRLGLVGWEMVNISTTQNLGNGNLQTVYAFFKKPVRPG